MPAGRRPAYYDGGDTSRVGELPASHPLVVICHHGARSRMIVDFLRDAGFGNAVNLEGGIEAWAREIDRSMRRY